MEETNHTHNMKYIKIHLFGLLTLILITTLSLMPAKEFPQVDVKFADKWTHGVMYGFLCLVMGIEAIRHRHRRERQHLPVGLSPIAEFFLIMLFCSAWGGLMELCQHYLTTTRSGDWLDALANSFGAMCAFIGLAVRHLVARPGAR